MAFDLAQAMANDTAVLHLKSAQGEPLTIKDAAGEDQPVTVTLYGPGSKQYQQAQMAAQRRVMVLMKKGKGDKRTPDERREDVAVLLADLTAGFTNLEYMGLQGRELAVAVYSEAKLGYIADQVNVFASDWANFTNGEQPA
jgi:hypothetical protein